jgi:hypothetical protein
MYNRKNGIFISGSFGSEVKSAKMKGNCHNKMEAARY